MTKAQEDTVVPKAHGDTIVPKAQEDITLKATDLAAPFFCALQQRATSLNSLQCGATSLETP